MNPTADLEHELNRRDRLRMMAFDASADREKRIQHLMKEHGWQRPAAERVANAEEQEAKAKTAKDNCKV